MKARTTLKLTSASSSATRTSLSASWMFSSVRRPRLPSRSKIDCSRVLRESSMKLPLYGTMWKISTSRQRLDLPRSDGSPPHAPDLGPGVGSGENRGAGHEDGGAVRHQWLDVLDLDATVHGELDGAVGE